MRRWLALILLVAACGGGAGGDDAPAGMVVVPAGWFAMGSERGRPNEQPVHDVWLDGFAIDRFEVTVAAYAAFVRDTGWRRPGNWQAAPPALPPDHPVTHVAWPDAAAFCAWAGKRLPTEAEWEKAARGTDGRTYPWGDAWAPELAAADLASGPLAVGTHEAGAGPYGAHDMAGNVHEWVADDYGADYYSASPARDPQGPDNHRNHVIRGGSWASPPEWVTTTFRDSSHSDTGDARFGFRCACSLEV